MNISSTTSTDSIKENTKTNSAAQTEKDGQTSFSEEYEQLMAQNGLLNDFAGQNFNMAMLNIKNDTQISSTHAAKGIHASFNYDTLTISKEDALFFNELVEKTDYIVNENNGNTFQTTLLKVTNESQDLKSTEVSKALMNLIEEAYKTQKPTRIDFDNNVSVILRINRDGKVSAEFIPGDKAVEQYLRNNIGYLKDRFEEQNLEYGDIMYKPYKDNSKRQRNNQGGAHNE